MLFRSKPMKTLALWLVLACTLSLRAQTVGQPTPDFTASTADGQYLSLSMFRGKVVIISFWATWCAPCKRNMPDLVRLSQQYGARGLVVIPVGMSPERETDIAWLRDHGYRFPSALYTDGWKTGPWYTIAAIPWMAVIDRQGIIRWTGHANIPESVVLSALKTPGN